MAINTALKQEIVSNATLNAFRDMLTPWNVFARDYGGELPQDGGNKVSVPLFNSLTAGTFAGDYTTSASNDVGAVEVTVDQHVYKTVKMTDLEKANNKVQLEDMGTQLGIALGLSFSNNILALITLANYGTAVVTSAAANFDSDDVVDIKTACTAANMPVAPRSLVLSSSYYDALLKDASVKNADKYGSIDAIQAGVIRGLGGFSSVYENTAVPDNSENLVGFACHPTGMALAMRYLQPGDGGRTYLNTGMLQDPESGVVIGMREFYLPETGTHYLTYEANFGRATAQTDGIKRITSA